MNSFEELQIHFGGPGTKVFSVPFQFLHHFAVCNDFEFCCSYWALLASFRCVNGLIVETDFAESIRRVSGWLETGYLSRKY